MPRAVVHLPVGDDADDDGQQRRRRTSIDRGAVVGEPDVVRAVEVGAGRSAPASSGADREHERSASTRTSDCTKANVRPRTSSATSSPSSV